MVYTSYFGKMRSFPPNMIPIAICGGIPDWYKLGISKVWWIKDGYGIRSWLLSGNFFKFGSKHMTTIIMSAIIMHWFWIN